ncbi:hypothetical protein [Mesorhizobium sp. WSM2239]|uniref:Uncharacterized protein n=2 Tax=unclassified Mesorhizobium TaxID=325217 RepID=A0AAU8D558_9HYPH
MPVRSFWKPFALVAAATCCAGSAHASSIVTLEAMTEQLGPSFVIAGPPDEAPAAAETDDRHMVSRSIIAFGPSNVAYENVASVGEKTQRDFSPMVLRGGIAGGAFPTGNGLPHADEREPAVVYDPKRTLAEKPAEPPPPEAPEAPRAPKPSGDPVIIDR